MNFSIASDHGAFGAVVIVFMVVIGIALVLGLLKTVFGGQKSIQEIEADQIDADLEVENDTESR